MGLHAPFVLLTRLANFVTEDQKVRKQKKKHIYKISTDSYITFI